MGFDVEMLALCSCLAGKRVRERRVGAFEAGRDVLRPWPRRPWLRLWYVVHATGIKGMYLGSAGSSWIGRGV